MILHLYWIETNWHNRGYAKNYNLIVYMEDKTYKVYTNSFYAYHRPEDVEVKRKSDITNYVEYLKTNGYTGIK